MKRSTLFLRAVGGGAVFLLALAAVLLASAPVHGAQGSLWAGLPAGPTPQWGSDVRINPITTITPDQQRNPSLAIDPTDPRHVIAGYDSLDPGVTNTGASYSTDGGRTWLGGQLHGPWLSGNDLVPDGSTSLGFDPHGIAYLTGMGTGSTTSGYFVLTSTLGSAWSTPVPIVISDYTQYHDQGHLVVEPREPGPYAGNLYFLYRLFTSTYNGVWLRYSPTRGKNWSRDVAVSDLGHEYVNGPSLAAAGNGELYAAFAENPDQYASSDTRFYLDHSLDGGRTWGTDRVISGAGIISKTGTLDYKGRAYVLAGGPGPGEPAFLLKNVPFLAVDPARPGTLYVVWNDGRWDQTYFYNQHYGKHGDIAFIRSTDSGTTWTAPVRLNDDPQGNSVDQFSPSIAVGPDGMVGVTWYDRRDDPLHFLYDVYYTQSSDGGVTWSANQRVSDAASDPMAGPNGKGEGIIGDYEALTYGPDYVLTCWVDTRGGRQQDIYADRGQLPTLSPTTTGTATATASNTPPATATRTATRTATPTSTPSPTVCAPVYNDVPPDAYYLPAVQWLTCHGVVSGYTCGAPGEPCPGAYYRPNADTTRGQVTKMVVNGLAWPVQTPPVPTFGDVPPSQTFYGYIETAYAHGVVNGYTGDGATINPCLGSVEASGQLYFRPCNPVTRGQLSKIVVNAKGWGLYTPPTPTFNDVPAGHPFFGYIERAYQKIIISGYSCGGTNPPEPCPGRYFRPAANASRGQLSKILYNALIQP